MGVPVLKMTASPSVNVFTDVIAHKCTHVCAPTHGYPLAAYVLQMSWEILNVI